jgi:Protein of unknown function (DUF3349)
VNRFLSSIVNWLRAGYPDGVPQRDYLPLFALLSGRLSGDEVRLVTRELITRAELDDADIGAEIIRLTDELPSPADIERVRERLSAKGWPLDEPRESDDSPIGSPTGTDTSTDIPADIAVDIPAEDEDRS